MPTQTYPTLPETWQDLIALIRQHGLDQEEYFSPDRQLDLTAPIWSDKTQWIAVFTVQGTSEGYYVHVETITTPDRQLIPRLLGKFWRLETALQAGEKITAWLYGNAAVYARYALTPPCHYSGWVSHADQQTLRSPRPSVLSWPAGNRHFGRWQTDCRYGYRYPVQPWHDFPGGNLPARRRV